MIKKYTYIYDFHEAEAEFEVDTEKFTAEIAQEVLDFWTWDYDEEADPVDEAMKKTAMEVIRVATFEGYNTDGVKDEFNSKEGWWKLDGSAGITLISVSGYEFDEDKLTKVE